MIISLGVSGKSMYMSCNQYFEMTDEDFKAAQAYDLGCYFSHPFTDTALIELVGEDEDEVEIEICGQEDDQDRSLFSLADIAELMASEHEE